MRFLMLMCLSRTRRNQHTLLNVRETFEKADCYSRSTTHHYVLSVFFPSAILILSEFRDKADAYFAGLTCYYERLIAERRHRIPVARLYFQQHTFEYTSHVLLDRKFFLAWTAQRSKVFQIPLLRDENHQLDLFNDLANDTCRHICLDALKALSFLSWLWRRFPYESKSICHDHYDTGPTRQQETLFTAALGQDTQMCILRDI
jgi:hypothetical protein